MARVDLQCPCGHNFFVGDAQLKQRGGAAECPACGNAVKPKAATMRKAAPVKAVDPRIRKFAILGGVGVVLLIAVFALLSLFSGAKPAVDHEQKAKLADEARRKKYEELSGSKDSEKAPPAPAPAAPKKLERPAEAKPPPSPPPAQPVAAPTPAPAAAPPEIDADLLARTRATVLGLHPFYLGLALTPAEKSRVEAIVAAGRGPSADSDYLTWILAGEKLKAVADEIVALGRLQPILEREAQENLPVDRIILHDGSRVVNCRILEEAPETVKIARALSGGTATQTIKKDAIKELEKGKGVGAEFTARWAAVKKDSISALIDMMAWCRENGLPPQVKLVACAIVRVDPSHAVARAEAGLPPDPVRQADASSAGSGMIAYEGKSWTAAELKDKFLKDGYCLVGGKWYSKKEKVVALPNLFRAEKQSDKSVVLGGNLQPCHDTETTYKQSVDPVTGDVVESADVKQVRRFYSPPMVVVLGGGAPPGTPPKSTPELRIQVDVDECRPAPGTPMSGEVTLRVPVGVPILEAAVMTLAEVKAGGSIVVYHVAGRGDEEKRTKLYACDPKENQSHPIPTELVRGRSELSFVAVIESPANYVAKTERRHLKNLIMKGKLITSPAVDVVHYRQIPDYKAVLFPSTANSGEVFRLKLAVGEPMPQIDKLFAGNPEVLK